MPDLLDGKGDRAYSCSVTYTWIIKHASYKTWLNSGVYMSPTVFSTLKNTQESELACSLLGERPRKGEQNQKLGK